MIHFGEMLEQSFEGEYIEEISDVVVFGHSMLDGSSPVWGPFSTHVARAVEPTPEMNKATYVGSSQAKGPLKI